MDIEKYVEQSLKKHEHRLSRLKRGIFKILREHGAIDFWETIIALNKEYRSRRHKAVQDLVQEHDRLLENKFSQYYQDEIDLQNKFDRTLAQIEHDLMHLLYYRIEFRVK